MIGLEPNITHQEFLELMNAISSAKSVNELIDVVQKSATYKLGLYHHIPAVGSDSSGLLNRFWSVGIPDEVSRYFKDKSDTREPVMQYVFEQSRPYWLSGLLEKDEFADGRGRHRVTLALQYLGDGLLVPLFGPFQKRGYIFIRFQKPCEFYDEIFLWQMQSVLQAIHIRYCMIIETLRSQVKLTRRESEVVELITFGKTNPEIGIILGISASTVAGHVKRIFLKFNATDRVTVALRAQSFNH